MPNMIHQYNNPNTCYVVGDSFVVILGTAATNRQPSAGVFEEISSLVKPDGTDAVQISDGSNVVDVIVGADVTLGGLESADGSRVQPENMAWKIGNGLFIRKTGTANRIAISGVQVDA